MHDAVHVARPPLSRSRRPSAIAWPLAVFAAVLAIATAYYQGQTLARGQDQADILLALFHDASHAIAEEGLLAAMYTPGVAGGVPNWSNPNFHPLYPLYFNWAGADASVDASLDRLNMISRLHLAILAAGVFTLARALGVRLVPALAVALVVPWFPAVRSAAGWPHIIAGMAWLPWILAFQARLYVDAGGGWQRALGPTLGLAAAATLMVYAHPAQNLVFAVFASLCAWALVGAQRALASGKDAAAVRGFAHASTWIAAAGVLVLAAAGAYLLELLRFHPQSIRWLGAYGGYVIGNQPLPEGAFRMHSLALADAGELMAYEYRRGIGNAYLGAALLLPALALLSPRLPRGMELAVARALLACAGFATLACFVFMVPVLAAIPLVDRVREITWWSCLAVVLVPPLAALGLQDLRLCAAGRSSRIVWLLAAAGAFLAALTATLHAKTDYRDEAVLALLSAFAALAWASWTSDTRARDIAIAGVLACSAWIPFRHNIAFDRNEATLYALDRIQARADAAMLRGLVSDEDLYRIMLSRELPRAGILTHSWMTAGLRSINGGIGPFNHAKFMLTGHPTPAVAALYGVRYVLVPEASMAPGDRLLRPGLGLRIDPAALPRLFLVEGGLRVAEDPVAALLALDATRPLAAYARASDLPPGLDLAAHAVGDPLRGRLELRENARTRLVATVASEGPAVLVLNEDPRARWRARVDGRRVPVFPVNGFQSGIAIDGAGRYEVEIERPGRLLR